MAKRKKKRPREKAATVDYVDADGNRLALRERLSRGTIAKIGEGPATAAASQEDAWHRRAELLFERLAVSWEIAGAPPIRRQNDLLARYRFASNEERRFIRDSIRQFGR